MQSSDLSSLTAALERWFRAAQRPLPWRSGYDPYRVWISEVMAQQTRLDVVVPYFERFVQRFPSVAALAAAPEEDVLAAWSGLGYYRRARMLRAGAIDVMTRFGGKLPRTVDELTSIAGIGRYTAGAISSIAFGQHAPIVDGNVARIASRIFGIEEPVGSPALMKAGWVAAERMVAACESPREFNQGLMEAGATICTPRKPRCPVCPVESLCVARRTGREEALPLAKARRAPVRMNVILYVVRDDRGQILLRRESGPLMTAMYHLPHGDDALLPGRPLTVAHSRPIGTFRHSVTTRAIAFEVHEATLGAAVADGDDYRWLDPATLDTVPHPSYVAKALRLAATVPRA